MSSNQCFLFPQAFSFPTTKILGEFLKFSLISSLNLTNFSFLWGGGGQGVEKFAKPLSQKIGKEKLKIANCHPPERQFSQILAIKNESKKYKIIKIKNKNPHLFKHPSIIYCLLPMISLW